MKVVIYDTPNRSEARAVEAGFQAHGIQPLWRRRTQWESSDLAVIWGHKATMQIREQRRAGRDYLIMEHGYFGDRITKFMSLGFNGLNGYAEFHAVGMPGDRWAKHGMPVSPWKTGGDYILVMGQVTGDASLATCPDYPAWLREVCEAAKGYGLPVRYRPHPLQRAAEVPPTPVMGGSLEDALAGAAAVIAWNSNSLVDAVLAGVPVIAGDRGSMAWPVAAHEVGAELVRPEREQWLHDLAYCQWTQTEIGSGEAWAHLCRRYAGRTDWMDFTPEPRHEPAAKRKQREAKERQRVKFLERQQLLARLAGVNGVNQ